MSVKVSICIPTYNRKEYLKQTLESILSQTYKDYEIVIIDDGSTDETEQMLKDTGYKVRYYWQGNQGEATTRNKLVELAAIGQFRGRYSQNCKLVPAKSKMACQRCFRRLPEVLRFYVFKSMIVSGINNAKS